MCRVSIGDRGQTNRDVSWTFAGELLAVVAQCDWRVQRLQAGSSMSPGSPIDLEPLPDCSSKLESYFQVSQPTAVLVLGAAGASLGAAAGASLAVVTC